MDRSATSPETKELVDRQGLEPRMPFGRQIYSLVQSPALLAIRCE